MIKILKHIMFFLLGILLFYSVIVIQPKETETLKIVLWGYVSVISVIGWAYLYGYRSPPFAKGKGQ